MINIGIVGAGYFGSVHAKAIAEIDGLQVAGFCSGTFAHAQACADTFGGTAYADCADLLADARIDAVVIATPHHLHESLAIVAAKAGKHILLEKPIAPTKSAGDAITQAAKAANVALMIGHVVHFMRPCMVAQSIIESGELGRPMLGYSQMIKLWMEENRKDWHLKTETGGGMLMTGGIHALDVLVWLMGQEVEAVSAQIGTYFHTQEADDSALLGLRFKGGGIGQIQSIGYRNGAMDYGAEIVCEQGTIGIDFAKGVAIGREGVWTEVEDSLDADPMHDAVVRQWQSFQESIVKGIEIAITGDYASHIVSVIEAAFQSNTERREVTL